MERNQIFLDIYSWGRCTSPCPLPFFRCNKVKKLNNPNPAAFGVCFGSWKFPTKRRGILSHQKEENTPKPLVWGSCCGVSSSHTHLPKTRHQQATQAWLTQDRHCSGWGWSARFKHQNATLGYKRAFAWTTQGVSTFSCLHVLPRLVFTSTCRMWIQVLSHWNTISGAVLCNIDTKIVWTKEIGFFFPLFFLLLNLNSAQESHGELCQHSLTQGRNERRQSWAHLILRAQHYSNLRNPHVFLQTV